MFSAFVDFLEHYFDIEDDSEYEIVLDYYFELAYMCSESLTDFLVG